MEKKFTFIFLFVFIAIAINAQRVKEAPPSFAFDQVAKQQLQTAQKLAIPFDVKALKAEDETKEAMGFPMRVAKTIPVQYTPENSGEWTTLPNGERIWRLEIDAPNATAISLLYDRFSISQGGKLYIYDLDYKVVNVYTDQDNRKRQEYSTEFIPGDKVRLEYVAPASAKVAYLGNDASQSDASMLNSGTAAASGLQLVISGVSYAYKDVIASIDAKFKDLFDNGGVEPRTPTELGASGDCEVNANCSEGDAWYHQKRGVAATLQVLSDGSYICSGTVVNNVLKDRTPYFLMAYHCGGDASAAQFNQWQFYFFWERTGCENTSPLETYQTLTGATLKVATPLNGSSDGLLLELNQPIPREWDVFFNGWDRRDVATSGGGVGIHHPAGDVKKISTYTQTPTSTTANMSTGEVGATNAHWSIAFVQTANGWGVTEGGSSGSPLFNADKRVIGTLTGGTSSCTAQSASNIYGKLAYHWNRSSDQNQWMAKYLDPNNTGAEYIDGTYGEDNLVAFTASATDIYASEEITFVNRSFGDIDTYEWDFGTPTAQPTGQFYTGQNPPSAVLYNTAGNYTVTLTAKKGSAVVDVFSVPITVTLKQNYCPAASPIAIGDPASATTSSFPLGLSTGGNNRQTLSSAIYTADELGLTNGGIITDLEWQANTASNASRTLYIYLKEVDESAFASGTTWATEISGLTPVYQAAFTNTAGAVKIHLTTPFTYSGTKNLKVMVRASTTGNQTASTACLYTATATSTHQQWANSTGTNPPTTSGTPNANRPNIKFYYNEGCGANPPVADFSISRTSIYEGETVTMTDLSTGPVVTYQWSFPGGIPSTSSDAAPTVQYMTQGVYDITLFVKNTEGTDTKTVTAAVTVSARTPVADFASSSNGFIKQADFGPFLPPTGGYVDFESLTLYYPQSFAWSFPGATPSSSTEENPEATYPEGANTYDVTLDATNIAGTGTITKSAYVKVDGTAEVWNILQGESTTFNLQYGGYSIFAPGATGYFPNGCSERFTPPAGGEISRVRVNIGAKSGSLTLRVAIYTDNDGVPGNQLAYVDITNANITAGNYVVANFTTPIALSDPFHIVLTRQSGTGNCRINSTDNRSIDYNTACVYYGNIGSGVWYVLSDILGYDASMNVAVEYTFTSAELTSPIAYKKKNIDNTPETISFTTNGHIWSATAANAWIHLSAASGSVSGGSGSLTFTVDDNDKQQLRKGSIDLNVAGTAFKVYVLQAGSYPIDLTAAYNDDNTGIDVNWAFDMQYQNGDIFENAEDYASFEKAPKGYYGWSYIDGDAQPTYGLTVGGLVVPGSGTPLSFIVIDADLTATTAHSGKRYFASLVAQPTSDGQVVPNNDWMISPELSFEEDFTFSFWARSFNSTYPEFFRVAYSTGGKTQADFTNVVSSGSSVTAPVAWTKYTYTIPANAKYVAVNCVSEDAFMFMLDDIFIGTGTAPASAHATENLLALRSTENTYTKVKRGEIPASVIGNNETLVQLPTDLKLGDVQKASKVKANATSITLLPEELNQGVVLKAATADDAPEEALQWHNDTPYYIYGNPNGGHMEVAVRFAPDDLFPYDGATIKAVDIYTYRPCGNLTLNIRQGNQIIYSQPVGNITDNLLEQRIELNSPVLIDASKDLYIGYEYDQYAGASGDVYVPIADAGPAVAGKGDLFSMNGSPLASTGVGNWIITTYVQPATVDVTFNLFRDGAMIAEGLTDKTYLDTDDLPNGTRVCYTVTAVYGDPELESTESDEACLYTNFIEVEGDTEFCQGESATLKAPEETGYTYQWYKDGNLIDDATESSYVVTESGDYHVVITTETSEVLSSETVTITVYALPSAPVITSADVDNQIVEGTTTTLSIESPEADTLYQWYKDSAALSDPSDETSITVSEGGTYYAVAVNENGCESEPSNEILITLIQADALFVPSANQIIFAAHNDAQTITLEVNDPNGLIASQGLNFYVNTPDWITYTITGNIITFIANENISGLIRTGVIQIWLGLPGSTFDPENGYELPVKQKSELLASMLNYSFADVVYTGRTYPVTVTLKSTYSGLGAISVFYNNSITAPSAVGTYTVTINAGSGANFDETSYLELGSFSITKASQVIQNYQTIPQLEVGGTFSIGALASSGLAVTYTSSNPSIVEVSSDGLVTAIAEGTGTITLSQAGNENYNAAKEVTLQVVVGKSLTGIDQIAIQSTTVYPNPAAKSTPVYVTTDIDESLLAGAIVTVYDASGSLVKNVKVTGKLTKIDLPATTGTYIFTLKAKDGVVIKNMKVVVK